MDFSLITPSTSRMHSTNVKPRLCNFVCLCLEKLIAGWLTKLGNLLASYAEVISFDLKVL